MGNFKKRLKKGQDNWDQAKDKGRSEWEDGLYKFQIQNAEVVESQSSNRLQVHVEHLCLEGDMAGETNHQYLQLETEWGPTFVMQMVERLGHEVPTNFEDIEEVIDAIAEAAPIYMAKIKTSKDGFQNLNITRLLEAEAEAPEAEDVEEEEEEEEDDVEEVEEEEEEEEEEDEEENEDDDDDDEDEDDDDEDDDDEEDEEEDEEEDDEEDDAETEVDIASLTALAQTLDIKVTDKDTVKTITKKVCEFEWDRSELLDDEVKLLEKIGATLSDPKPKDKPKAKDKKKPAKKAAKAPAKKATKNGKKPVKKSTKTKQGGRTKKKGKK